MVAIAVFILSYAAFASYDVTVLIDGEKLDCSVAPFITEGVTYVPMRDIFEGMKATVLWNEEERSASVSCNNINMTLFPDSGICIKNGEEIQLSQKILIVNDKIMLPLRVIAENFGYSVIWRGNDYTVSIGTQGVINTHFLDCGQADSIFVELPDGKCMLIDAAESSFGKALEKYIREKGYSHIDYVVATHPHSDHIGGMAHILNSFTVGTFYMPEIIHTTKTFENMLDALSKNGCKCEYISQGYIIEDESYDIAVLSPQKKEYIRMNDYSAVIKLCYKNTQILFSADAELTAEQEMLRANLDLKADILKVGHHGSFSSTMENYLDAVSPSDAVISVGKNNSYGFPDEIVLRQLEERGIKVHRTDINGTVSIVSDGYIYVVK